MSARSKRLRPGDLVELRSPDEIAGTLDSDGALDHLPFMPEMLEFCGQRFRVARRALTLCCYGHGPWRGFPDSVVTLDGLRCSGAAHGGCPKACMIFWHEAWLQKADHNSLPPAADSQAIEALRRRLKVSTGSKTYFCQASELPNATCTLERSARLTRYVRGLLVGNFSLFEMARSVGTFTVWWTRRKLFGGVYPRGDGKRTAADNLNLQPGEWVEVKPLRVISETLDEKGLNRGLWFSPGMRLACGQKLRVKSRLDRIIVDGTGQVRELRDTVILEGSTCGCAYMNLGIAGCSRCEFNYWREAWLRRCSAPDHEPPASDGQRRRGSSHSLRSGARNRLPA